MITVVVFDKTVNGQFRYLKLHISAARENRSVRACVRPGPGNQEYSTAEFNDGYTSVGALGIEVEKIGALERAILRTDRELDGRLAVLLLLRGNGHLDVGPQTLLMQGPAVVILPSRTVESTACTASGHGYWVIFDPQNLGLLSTREADFGKLFRVPRIVCVDQAAVEELKTLESAIQDLEQERCRRAPARAMAIAAYTQLILVTVLRITRHANPNEFTTLEPTPTLATMLVKRFLDLVAEHAADGWRIKDYAHALHVTADHLRATCTRITGRPPVQHVHAVLLREARFRLAANKSPIHTIAIDLGFGDPAYFSRLFRLHVGLSPKQFRSRFQRSN